MNIIRRYILFLLISISFVSFSIAQNSNYFSRTFIITFPNGEANKVVYINFPNVGIWGNLKVTLSGGYNYQLNIGELSKTFSIIYNVNSAFSQEIEIPTSYGSLAKQWAIGDFDNSNMRIPIYHLVSKGNQITIRVEGQLLHSTSVNSIETNLHLSSLETYSAPQDRQFVYYSNNMGIGTLTPNYKLDVEGTIRAHEIKVNLNEGADFVFEEDYNLMPLNELEAFIKTRKHLPEVDPAKKMEEEGLSISEMNIKLLQKIEELTLYVIDQDKNTQELIKRVENLETENRELKKEIELTIN